MKALNKIGSPLLLPLLLGALLLAGLLAVPALVLAAQPTVDLGTTSSFAVLAGSTITNTGATTISGSAGGNVGLYPGTSFPGQAQVTLSGTVHLADSVAQAAKDDLVTAYNDAAGRTPVTRIPTELGGTTLTPGVYDSASGTFHITGTLTLDAQGDPNGVFVFKTSSTLITASNSNVNLINRARYCRTFWKVGSSATLGTNSHFVGHIFALTSITANTGATVQGQLLARNGAVTLDTNTITNGICATTSTTTSESTTSTTVSESTTSTTTSESTTSTTAPESTTSTTAPESTTSTTVSESTTSTTVSESTTSTTAPESTTSTTAPEATTSTTGPASTTSTMAPASTTSTTTPESTTSTTTHARTTSTTAPASTTSTTAPARTTSTTAPESSTTSTTVWTSTSSTTPTTTVRGGQLPKTGTPWYNVLFAGGLLASFGVLGFAGYCGTTRKIHG